MQLGSITAHLVQQLRQTAHSRGKQKSLQRNAALNCGKGIKEENMKETILTFTITATKIIERGECCKGCEKTFANAIQLELEDHCFDELRIETQRFELDHD
jgi:hypothetical protein